ncbi:right-handed parallel beta-helix repeat-containing protein [candidate division KSB1 bacterium]|nr:right-handed parallel beta-helix repeat-containing protein [candidate division KSB1 bacterium]
MTTRVAPVSTAGTVNPPYVAVDCGGEVELEAKAEDGWAFIEWQGAAGGTATRTKVRVNGNAPDNCDEAVGLFGPILVLSAGPDNPDYQPVCPPQEEDENTNTLITQIRLSASEADDWNVNSIVFYTEGTGDEKEGVKLAKLHLGGENGTILSQNVFLSDGDNLVFPVDLTIYASTSVLLTVTYDFNVYNRNEDDTYLGEFYAFTNMALIEAKPATYEPGVQMPSDQPKFKRVIGGPTVVGCVHNILAQAVFDSIQTAIDDTETQDGHTIKVCPGQYKENVVLKKELKLLSFNGPEVTTVMANNSSDNVVVFEKDNSTLNGFTITGAVAKEIAGIAIVAKPETPYLTKCNVENNIIINNNYGLFVKRGLEHKITGNKITLSYLGAFFEAAEKIEFKNNELNSIAYRGIQLQKASNFSKFENNIIEGTKKEESIGIILHSICDENTLNKNTIKFFQYGIYVDDLCKSNKIIENIISDFYATSPENDGATAGIRIKNSHENEIEKNTITGPNNALILDHSDGVLLNAANENVFQENRIKFFHTGIWLDNADKNKLYKNEITQNVDGIILNQDDNEIYENSITGNATHAILISAGSRNKIRDNDIRENGFLKVSIDQIGGIRIESLAVENEIQGNKIINNAGIGILIAELLGSNPQKHTIRSNEISGSTGGAIFIDTGDEHIISDNQISGNQGPGIILAKSQRSTIEKNQITSCTTNKQGNPNVAHNIGQGIALFECRKTGVNENLISGNDLFGMFLQQSSDNIIYDNDLANNKDVGLVLIESSQKNNIRSNRIHTNQSSGLSIKENSHENTVENNEIYDNNAYGVVVLENSNQTSIRKNKINSNKWEGICFFTKSSKAVVTSNEITSNELEGISVKEAAEMNISENKILNNGGSGIDGVKLGGFKLHDNRIVNNFGAGISLVSCSEGEIYANKLLYNQYQGLDMVMCKKINVFNNTVIGNNRNVSVENSPGTGPVITYSARITISNNNIEGGQSPSSGIHLENAVAEICYNQIHHDVGDGISCRNGSNPIVYSNNIFDNNGFGLNNLDTTFPIAAWNNWWGDAAGPQSGDGINGNVMFSNWRSIPVSVAVFAQNDTSFIAAGQQDSVICAFQNWTNPDDVLDVEISADSSGWLGQSTHFSVTLQDSVGADTFIICTIPYGITAGAHSKIKIKAVSRSNPSQSAVDSVTVMVYHSTLASITISPDTARIRTGMSVPFSATGYDSLGMPLDIDVIWSATGGGNKQHRSIYSRKHRRIFLCFCVKSGHSCPGQRFYLYPARTGKNIGYARFLGYDALQCVTVYRPGI